MRSALLLPADVNSTGELLAQAAVARGIHVARVADRVVPGRLRRDHAVHLYGGPRFAGYFAAELAVALLEPADEWLTRLPAEFLRREVVLTTLGDARWLRRPMFVKEPREKHLPAAVYADGSRLPHLPPDTAVLVSDIVTFATEYRLFVLDGQVRTASRYATFGRLDPAPLDRDQHRDRVYEFAGHLLRKHAHTLPSAVVVDVGLTMNPDNGDEGWAVVEANMAWFASSYAADLDGVLDVVLRSAGPASELLVRDRAFANSGHDGPAT